MNTHVTVIAGKGGAAKSTTTLCMGDALARRGEKVLLVDFDPQGSVSDWMLGLRVRTGVEKVLIGEVTAAATWLPLREEELYLLPVTRELSHADPFELGMQMRGIIDEASASGFTQVIIDTPASRPMGDDVTLHVPALYVAHTVIVAFEPSVLSYAALPATLDDLVDLQRSLGRPVDVLILPTRCLNTVQSFKALTLVREKHGDTVLPRVRNRALVGQAVDAGALVADLFPTADVTEDYAAVAEGLLRRQSQPVAA